MMASPALQHRVVFDNDKPIPSDWIAIVKLKQVGNVWKVVAVTSHGSHYTKTFFVADSLEKRNDAAKWFENLKAISLSQEVPFPELEMN